jgi:hypothetical protein
MTNEKLVFSFSLYGTKNKYTEGMIINAALITARFPESRINIYTADDVPSTAIERLNAFPIVRVIPVKRLPDAANMIDRFMSIDDTDCDIMIVRDADSRVNERDVVCILEFISSSCALHIIRDHKNHIEPIMGGLWGIRKDAFAQKSMRQLVNTWCSRNPSLGYGADQNFLRATIYPMFRASALIHDRHRHFPGIEHCRPIPHMLVGDHFIGNTYDFNDKGGEYTVYSDS